MLNEENMKLSLAMVDLCIQNLKPNNIKQSDLNGLRKAIKLMYEDKSVDDVCNSLADDGLPML